MFAPDWEEGCPSCSLLGDHLSGSIAHAAQRDVTLLAASRAPLEKLRAFQDRLGWSFPWVSTVGDDFNADFGVYWPDRPDEQAEVEYNYGRRAFPSTDGPGASAFLRADGGRILHTYSTYARGLDMLIGVYNWLDLAPHGRNEDELPYTMAWVKHHDKYGGDLVELLGAHK